MPISDMCEATMAADRTVPLGPSSRLPRFSVHPSNYTTEVAHRPSLGFYRALAVSFGLRKLILNLILEYIHEVHDRI